jgi:hypothetical protein
VPICVIWNTHNRGLAFQLVLAQDGGSGMVEDVQECWKLKDVCKLQRSLGFDMMILTQLLLLEDQEHGVDQFHVFKVVVDDVV